MKYIHKLLSEMTIEQKAPIIKILGLKANDNNIIVEKLSKVLLPANGFLQSSLSYKEFIEKIVSKNNEKIDWSLGIPNAEKELYLNLFKQEFDKLTEDEKNNIYRELEKAGLDKNQIKSLSGISAIGAAQISGFGVYLLASSTLGAITSVLGITLPFAFYTGMSSAISFVIGPVGFLVMGVLVYRSFKNLKSFDEVIDLLRASWKEMKAILFGDYTRGTLVFKYLAATRIVLTENYKNQIEENISDIDIKKNNISKIKDEIKVNEQEIVNTSNFKQEKFNVVSSIKLEILKKQEEMNVIFIEINKLNNSIKNIEITKIDKINEIETITTNIFNKENESKIISAKITNLNTL